MCDDIFDDSDESERIAEKSWNKMIGEINKSGYREGLEAGKEEVLQEGFNKTFTTSSQLLYTTAQLRGRISAKLSYGLLKSGSLDKQRETDLQDLLENVIHLESDLLQFSNMDITDPTLNQICSGTCTKTKYMTNQRADTSHVTGNDDNRTVESRCDRDVSPLRSYNGAEMEHSDSSKMTDKPCEAEETDKTTVEMGKTESNFISKTDARTRKKSDSAILTVSLIQDRLSSLSEQYNSITSM